MMPRGAVEALSVWGWLGREAWDGEADEDGAEGMESGSSGCCWRVRRVLGRIS